MLESARHRTLPGTILARSTKVVFSIAKVKLNTDGSSLGNPGLAGGGGLIRDEEGKWIAGFARKIGKTTSFFAELCALRDGLNVCISHNFAAVEVEFRRQSHS